MEFIHNKAELKALRKNLRNNGTPAEAALWNALKNSQLEGRKFRRQHSVGRFILDFYCPSERLAIELDGESHDNEATQENDQARSEYLNSLNIRVLRFENQAVMENPDGVLEKIRMEFMGRS